VTVPRGLSITADSTNGTVTAELGVSGDISTTTTNSDIDIACQRAASFDLTSTNGAVDLSCETAVETDVETTSDDVTIEFPSAAALALTLETQIGEITVGDFDAGTVAAESSVSADIGSGTTPVAVETTNGSITVKPT
jgi:DUF4097 and DUF4098 domain-containing protein YvlB